MLCKTCGSKLIINGAFYVCEGCGSKSTISSLYENVDTYIAYIENDEQGRRTKDSIIGQEIYNKLENAKINTFYQRISTDGLNDTDFETARDSALSSAMVLIIIGTNKENFEEVVNQYRNIFQNKKIIPIYSGIDAYDLPEEIKRLQALNYDSVGSINDVIKNILSVLGRGSEMDVMVEANKKATRKKKVILTTIILLTTMIIGVAAYIVFGTTYVLPSKKYEQAQSFIDKEEYVPAINILVNIRDYKDSDAMLKSIYAQYAGYYQSEDKSVGLHFTVDNNSKATVEIDRYVDGLGVIKITESAEIITNCLETSFTDSENNQGTIKVELENEGINLFFKMDEQTEGVNYFFKLAEKSDKPMQRAITAETIKDWLLNPLNENDFRTKGYELTDFSYLNRAGDDATAKIVNTDIEIVLTGDKTSGREAQGYAVPAHILAPDKIGQKCLPYIKDNILYVPDATFSNMGYPFGFYDADTTDVIKDDTIIACTAKNIVGDEWDNFVMDYMYKRRVVLLAMEMYDKYFMDMDLVYEAENTTHYLFSIPIESESKALMFRVNKASYEVESLPDAYCEFSGFSRQVMWEMNEDLYFEFYSETYDEY